MLRVYKIARIYDNVLRVYKIAKIYDNVLRVYKIVRIYDNVLRVYESALDNPKKPRCHFFRDIL